MGCPERARRAPPLASFQLPSLCPYCNTLVNQDILLAWTQRRVNLEPQGLVHSPRPHGTGFKGEGKTFNPNTPRNISQSTERSNCTPGAKRESRGRDRAGAMPGPNTKPGKASSERTTTICRISSSDTRRYHSTAKGGIRVYHTWKPSFRIVDLFGVAEVVVWSVREDRGKENYGGGHGKSSRQLLKVGQGYVGT